MITIVKWVKEKKPGRMIFQNTHLYDNHKYVMICGVVRKCETSNANKYRKENDMNNTKIPNGWKVAKIQFIPFAARAAVAVNGKIRYVGARYKIAHPEVICVERV